MILDCISNIDRYTKLSERLTTALNFLKTHDFSTYEPGKYELDGDNIYFMIQAYMTKPDNEMKWENHRKYLDIQCILEGEEIAGVAPISSLTLIEEYSVEKDMEFYSNNEISTNVYLIPKTYAIFFPGEAHKPCVQCDKPVKCKKVIIKVKAV